MELSSQLDFLKHLFSAKAQLFVKYVEIFFSQFNNFSLLILNNRFQGQPIYFKLKKNTYI